VAEPSPTNAQPLVRHRALVLQVYLILAVIVFLILEVLEKMVAYFPFDLAITQALQEYNPWRMLRMPHSSRKNPKALDLFRHPHEQIPHRRIWLTASSPGSGDCFCR
jgi:hypothetical protein